MNASNHGFADSNLTQDDLVVVQNMVENRARAVATTAAEFAWLSTDPRYRNAVTMEYLVSKRGQQNEHIRLGPEPLRDYQYEGEARDRIAAEYGVVMDQFQNRFKDTTGDNLRTGCMEDRLRIYHDRIGYLGMKTFDVRAVPLRHLVESLFLYVLDDIERKQKDSRNHAGEQFLQRIGMEEDLLSYYKAHRKSNHGGASSALYAFNETETFSFRRQCMRSGLQTDVEAMKEADAKGSKTHPYQRTFYGCARGDNRKSG
jgi:hypothetical protein